MKQTKLLSSNIIVRHKPIHSFFDSLSHRSKLVIRKILSQLRVRRCFLVLPIGLCVIVFNIMIVNSICNIIHHIADRHFLVFSHREDDGLDLLVLAHHPQDQFSHVHIVDELTKRLSRAPHTHRFAALLGLVELVDQSGNHVATFDLEIVERPVDVGGNDGCEVASILLRIKTIHHLNHALGIRVALIRIVWRTIMDHRLIDRIGSLIREDASRETRNQLLHLKFTAQFHHIHVHNDIIIVKLYLVGHVVKQAANLSS